MKKFLVISCIIAPTWCLFESIRKPEKGCAFQESTRSVPVILVLWVTWAPTLRTVKSGLFDYRYLTIIPRARMGSESIALIIDHLLDFTNKYAIACHSVTEGYKRTGNGWCTRGEKATERLTYVCFSVLMLCDWLILTWHLPTLERVIKRLSGEMIERVTR